MSFFQFLLLRNVKDQNYPKPRKPTETQPPVPDTGERHVFEITLRDGTKWHLHYHSNGKHDPPYKIPPFSSIWHEAYASTGSFLQWNSSWEPIEPEFFSRESILRSTPEHNTPLGTEELRNALCELCPDGETTLDITDMRAVHWHRWLKTIKEPMAATYIGTGIQRVFAFTLPVPTIVFAHPENNYTCVELSPTKKGRRQQNATREGDDWKHVFSDATRAFTSWLRTPATDAW